MRPVQFKRPLRQIVLASANPGKLKEFSALFQPLGIELIPQGTLGIQDAEEPFDTFVENALTKARHASLQSGLPALADDSGICVSYLLGEPGIHSARYAQDEHGNRSDEANNKKLIQELKDAPDRSAWYVAVLVLVLRHDDPQPVIAEAIWKGQVLEQAKGEHGFGYDPYFFLPEEGLTAAELSAERKNQISHRAQALQLLLKQLALRDLLGAALPTENVQA